MPIRILILGDIVGRNGVQMVAQHMAALRNRHHPDLVIVNAENAADGSGLTRELFKQLTDAGVDGVTLGDHVYKRAQIIPFLDQFDNLTRPANLPERAKGHRWMRLAVGGENRAATTQAGPYSPGAYEGPMINIYVLTVLGRLHCTLPVDEPLAVLDQVLAELPERNPIVLVEVHAEATAEKQAIGWYLDGRVALVYGTHTHVATADARLLHHGTGYVTDLGMCGPFDSVIGRRTDRVLLHMSTSMPAPFDVAEGDLRINGILVDIDAKTRATLAIERVDVRQDPA
ncbi:MAG: TIGR00282 family metallophosphoesterase [Phycisphaeraceae bacterium]